MCQKAFNDLRIDNADNIVKVSQDSFPVLMKNQKVYETNMDLLARYNA